MYEHRHYRRILRRQHTGKRESSSMSAQHTPDIEKIKLTAIASTQEQWFVEDETYVMRNLTIEESDERSFGHVAASCDDARDAAYIAAANPVTVLALIEQHDRLAALNAELRRAALCVAWQVRTQYMATNKADAANKLSHELARLEAIAKVGVK